MKEKCKSFDNCSAPMCPLDENVGNYIWYPKENICSNPLHNKNDWIKNQRKYEKRSIEGYYTLDMLKRSCMITLGTKGLNPDKLVSEEKEQLKKWFKNHPIKRESTEEEKQEKRDLFNKRLNR